MREGLRINHIISLNSWRWPAFSRIVSQSTTWTREEASRRFAIRSIVTETDAPLTANSRILLIKVSHYLNDIPLANSKRAENSSVDIGQHTLVYRVPVEGLRVVFAKPDRNIAGQEELEPVVLWLLGGVLNGGTSIRRA